MLSFSSHHILCEILYLVPGFNDVMDSCRTVMLLLIVYFISLQTVCTSEQCYCLQKQVSDIDSPVFVQQSPQNGEFYVAEQTGAIRIFSSDWKRESKPLINLTHIVFISDYTYDERGLLSLALHPQFTTNKLIFTYSIRLINGKEYAVISKLRLMQDFIKDSILLAIEQPHHMRNGGQVLFGKDGYLYVSVGDGGALDKQNVSYAQSRSSLLGKILRIDVDKTDIINDHVQLYSVPRTNPFYGNQSYRPEIYAMGARNMWRCSVDTDTGKLYCGDAGNDKAEEINLIKSGKNYGWNIFEGRKAKETSNTDTTVNEPPIYSYPHGHMGHAVVGGYVYRGSAFKNLQGYYIFGDYVSGKFFKLDLQGSGPSSFSHFSMCQKDRCPCGSRDKAGLFLQSFSTDNQEELYILAKQNGEILKLIPPLSAVTTCGSEELTSNVLVTVLATVVIFCISS